MAAEHVENRRVDRCDVLRKFLRTHRQSDLQLRVRDPDRRAQHQLISPSSAHEKKYPGFDRAIASLEASSAPPRFEKFSRKHVLALLSQFPETPAITAIAAACFAAARRGARILITESDSQSFIEFTNAAVARASRVFGCSGMSVVERVIAVDGMIQSVGEIDRLLTQALDCRECIILCRGASDDVRQTVNANVCLGKMKLAIAVFEIEIENANALGDACALMGIKLHDAMSTGASWPLSGFERPRCDVKLDDKTLRITAQNRDIARETSAKRFAAAAHDELRDSSRLASLGSVVKVNVQLSHSSALFAATLAASIATLDDAALHGVMVTCDDAVHPAKSYCAARDFLTTV